MTVNFTNESSGDITDWHWDFGDGNTSSEENPQHIYAIPGIFSVSLTVSGIAGTDSKTKEAYITAETIFYRDADDDGFGNNDDSMSSCTVPTGYVLDNTDCNDENPMIYPGAAEIDNDIDDDCDGEVDEGFPVEPIKPPDENMNDNGGGSGGCFITELKTQACPKSTTVQGCWTASLKKLQPGSLK